MYIYDETGAPIGLKYREKGYAVDKFDNYFYGKNLQGDITEIYNENGTAVVKYLYDAWGKIISASGTLVNTIGTMNPFRYRGYYYDSETDFYYLQSRYYDPWTGRFINADNVSYLGENDDLKGYNLYSYCDNNPVMYIDPDGHVAISAIIVGAVIGFAVAAYVDYADDGQIFNGSVAWYHYVGATVLGGLIGAGISYSLPYISSFASTSFTIGGGLSISAGGAATMYAGVTITGAQILRGVGILVGAGVVLINFMSKSDSGPMKFNDGTGIDPDTGDYVKEKERAYEIYHSLKDKTKKAHWKQWMKYKRWMKSHLD